MPAIHSQSPNLIESGATVPVRIWLSQRAIEALETAGQPLPQPIQILALIDTGAASTCITRAVATALNLQPDGIGIANTASHRAVPVNQFLASVIFPNNVAVNCRALEMSLEGQGIDCLIGRDILSKGIFVYVGETGSFTLSF